MWRVISISFVIFLAYLCVGSENACALGNVLRQYEEPPPIELRPATNRTRFGQPYLVDRIVLDPQITKADASLQDENFIEPDELAAEPYEEESEEPEFLPAPGHLHHPTSPIPPSMIDKYGREKARRIRRRMKGCVPDPRWSTYDPPLFGSFFARLWEGHRDPNDPDRHCGVGEPLVGTSWRNRPWYVNGFLGGMIGDELQAGLVDQGGGVIVGGRFGGDFDHYWGSEIRVALSDLNVNYPNVNRSGQSRTTFFDANFLYYPLGDTRWRPFFTFGFGFGGFKYDDVNGKQIHASAISLPFGGGLKYLIGRQWAMRFDITDNFTWDSGSHADSMHNISFTGGVEYHFGGNGTSYGPW